MEDKNIKELLLQMREEDYKKYKEDVDIAVNELTKMKLHPFDGRIICDLYAIPSHNQQTYYAIVYEKNGRYDMVYAKPQFYDPITHETIKMYRFKDAKEVEGHPVKDGKIIIGIKPLSEEFASVLIDIANNLPSVKKNVEGFVLDGYFQVLRAYKDGDVFDEACFKSGDDLVFSEGKAYLESVLDNLYIEIGMLIE